MLAACVAAAALLACADRAKSPQPFAPIHALADRESGGVHISLVWESSDEEFRARLLSELDGPAGRAAWERWSSAGARRDLLRSSRAVELEFEAPLEGFEAALDLVASAGARAMNTTADATPPMEIVDELASDWRRRAALGLERDGESEPSWRWHVSALCGRNDFERVDRALSALESRVAKFTPRAASAAAPPPGGAAEVLLIESSATSSSELRWIPPAELSPTATSEDRARSCVLGAELALRLRGWTFVPASVDGLGRREVACLYAAGSFSTVEQRFEELRSALAQGGLPGIDPETSADAARGRRAAFARAQLSQERFRLRAMHGDFLARFESDATALERLDAESLRQPLDSKGARWTLVGPADAWLASLSVLGRVEILRTPPSASRDAAAERDLKRMWDALGGPAPWSTLNTLRTLSVIHVEEDGSTQGIEQWIDFASNRFALAQAIGTVETVLVATAAEAWTVDGESGIDLTEIQAQKLRMRQERSLFAILRRLASDGRGGVEVRRAGERLELSAEGRALCWMELEQGGLPARLGYRLDAFGEESTYEFQDWKRDAKLVHPARTLQVDRARTVDLQYVEPNAKLDPALWERQRR